ncbi:MAG: Ig-like domain repeat protein, partial [Terracidiphilus sp.]
VTGNTTMNNYPVTTGAFQPTCPENDNYPAGQGPCNTGFLSKINPTGTANIWSTFFGGTSSSSGYGVSIAFDAKERVYLYGYDTNYGYDLPLVNPLEGRPGNGSSYPYVATFTPNGTKLIFATPLGNENPAAGNTFPIFNGMALDADGNVYFAAYGADGGTWNTTMVTPGTYATPYVGGYIRSFFGKFSPVMDPTATTLTISPSTAVFGQTVTFTATVAGTAVTTPTPTGTVTLVNPSGDPVTTLGTITLGTNGSGKFTTSSLPVGSYSATATYSADSNYEVSTSSAQALTINQATQTITFAALPDKTYGATPFTVSATASSGLAVSFASTTTSVCTVSGSTVTLVSGAANCSIEATQAGNGDYDAAPATTRTFWVYKEAQTITFATLPDQTYGVAPFTVSATASSGLPVSFTSTTTSVCTVSGSTVTLVSAAADCTIEATQVGNGDYGAAPATTRTFWVYKGAQTITFAPLPDKTYGAAPFTVSATASSGLPVSFASTPHRSAPFRVRL